MLVLAIFFAYLVDPLVKMIRKPFVEKNLGKYMPRPLAIGIAYLIIFGVLVLAVIYLSPLIAAQAREFAGKMPSYAASLQESINNFNRSLDRMRVSQNIQDLINDKINSFIGSTGTYLTDSAGTIAIDLAKYLPWFILIPILAFFFLKDVNLFRIGLLRIFPIGRWRTRVESVLNDINNTLAAYVRAQLISCLLIGIICTVGFYLLGNNYALLLGILAGIFEFVPLIGPLAIAVLATLVAGFESGWQSLWTAIFLAVLRIVQDYVIYPRIVREGIHLHPLAIILSVLAGEQVAGIPGVFLSIPIVALLTVLYKHVLEHLGTKGFFVGMLEPEENIEIAENAEKHI
jgi:predicted PurR-regulated permease PerM